MAYDRRSAPQEVTGVAIGPVIPPRTDGWLKRLPAGEAMRQAVVRLVPAQLPPEALGGRRRVDTDQLDPGDHGVVLERLYVNGSAEHGVVRATGAQPGLR